MRAPSGLLHLWPPVHLIRTCVSRKSGGRRGIGDIGGNSVGIGARFASNPTVCAAWPPEARLRHGAPNGWPGGVRYGDPPGSGRSRGVAGHRLQSPRQSGCRLSACWRCWSALGGGSDWQWHQAPPREGVAIDAAHARAAPVHGVTVCAEARTSLPSLGCAGDAQRRKPP